MHQLLAEGAEIKAFDPAAIGRAREVFGSQIEFAQSAYEVAEGSDALLVLTDWEEFAHLDLNVIREKLKYPIVVDGRNLYNRQTMAEAGLIYYSVGRTPAGLEHLTGAALARVAERQPCYAARHATRAQEPRHHVANDANPSNR